MTSRWERFLVAGALACVLAATGCMLRPRDWSPPDYLGLHSGLYLENRPDAPVGPPPYLFWAIDEPVLVVVDRELREVQVYRHGQRAERYPAVFGRQPGSKLFEGDARTPSGVYRVVGKRDHARFHRFLDIDYPSGTDLRRYRAALVDGDVPLEDGAPAGPGSLLGIHGTDDGRLNRYDVDWTLGCVSLRNDDIEALYEKVPEGALVLFRAPPATG